MKYKAFISYSHKADRDFARSLQISIEKLAKPWYKPRVFNIFRDETNLSVSPHLWGTIQQALTDSEFFILLASIESANSKWVTKEIEFWLRNKSLETLIIVLTDGTIKWDDKVNDFDWEETNALPNTLKSIFPGEPHYVKCKFRGKGLDLNLDNEPFTESIMPIAAKLHDKNIDDLFGEIAEQHKKMIRIRNRVIYALSILVIISVGAAWMAYIQKNRALFEARRATSNMFTARSSHELDNNPTRSLRLGEIAYNIDEGNPFAYSALLRAYYEADAFFSVITKSEEILSASLSPDGKRFVTAEGIGEEGGLAKIYDLKGKELRVLDHHGKVLSLAFSSDGKYLITAGQDGTAKIWSINGNDNRKPVVLKGHNLDVTSAVFSPDDKFIVTTCLDQQGQPF